MMDQRLKTRYELHLPFEIHGVAGRTKVLGHTRNLSGSAVLFPVPAPVAPGETLQYTLTLPKQPGTRAEIRVYCSGKVVRTDPEEFVASIDTYEIVREMAASAAA